MALEINLGDISKIKDCCIGDYLLCPSSLQLYRVVKGVNSNPLLVIDVETASTILCFKGMNDLITSSFYKDVILIPESEFELNKK